MCGATQIPTGYKYASMAVDVLCELRPCGAEGFTSLDDQRITWAQTIEKGKTSLGDQLPDFLFHGIIQIAKGRRVGGRATIL